MSDPFDRLGAELASMRPRSASDELINAIGKRIDAGEARPWADRCLLASIGAGAAAACVIVVMLLPPSRASDTAGGQPGPMLATIRLEESPLALNRLEP